MADLRMGLDFLLRAEIDQRQQEGCDVAAVEEKLKALGDQPLRRRGRQKDNSCAQSGHLS